MTSVHLAVNGSLMQGLEMNCSLVNTGGEFVRATKTAPCYRLWSINDRHPAMLRAQSDGQAIAVEIWKISAAGLVDILLLEPPGLSLGKVLLADGNEVLGVLGEPLLCEGQLEITRFGGWRAYLASSNGSPPAKQTPPARTSP